MIRSQNEKRKGLWKIQGIYLTLSFWRKSYLHGEPKYKYNISGRNICRIPGIRKIKAFEEYGLFEN